MNWLKKYNRNRWNLAFFPEKRLDSVLAGDYSAVRWMKYSDRTRWFADPFILEVFDTQIALLVEEFSYSMNKGRIAKLIVNRRTWKLESMKIILELGTHLSFPMILRRDKDIIIIPENSVSGASYAYRYSPYDDSVAQIAVVINEPLTDATILRIDGTSKLLSTSVPTQNGSEISVFDFNETTLEATNKTTICFDHAIARNAGSPFLHNGKIFRPAQDCEGAYGKGVIVQEIEYDDNGDLRFKDVASIYPFAFKYHLGLHTLNVYDGMCVIDARGLLYPRLGRLVRPLVSGAYKFIGR